MTDNESSRDRDRLTDRLSTLGRRPFIAAGGALSATVLAGCASEDSPADDSTDDGDDETSDETDEEPSTVAAGDGNFRLLISDMPADIGDFERLDVSFDSARIFDGGNGSEEEDDTGDDSENTTESMDEPEDGTDDQPEDDEDDEETSDEPDDAEDPDDESDESNNGADGDDETNGDSSNDADEGGNVVERRGGFYVLDLEGATVDLTQVIGDKAISVFDGELSPGSYGKIELHVADVEGIVDGERAEVKVPSEKLQITHGFEISDEEPVEFVFDINVVKRGQGNSYNLTPVISKSGINGTDVDVEEVDSDEGESDDSGEDADADGTGDDTDGNGDGDTDSENGETDNDQ